MNTLERYVVAPSASVKTAIEQMDRENIKAVVVVNSDNIVQGLFSNGDMRSFFLKGGTLEETIAHAMNPHPVLYCSEEEIQAERRNLLRVLYPIVDGEGKLLRVVDYGKIGGENVVSDALKEVPLVIMAGGKGTRLYPYTKVIPKPLIPIGDATITERIIHSFCEYGCQRVIMILNYKANMIKAYMSDLDTEYTMEFVEEKEFLGTAGGLKLIQGRIRNTFIVSNCDTLSNVDMECVYKTHKANNNKITMVCSMKDFVVPFGVVDTDESGAVVNLREKPGYSLLVNTGLYMIEPEVLTVMGDNEFIDLPDLAKRLMDSGERVGVFPISESSWLDMGQISEMEKMKKSLGIID